MANLPVNEAKSAVVILNDALPAVQQLRLADFMEEVLGCNRFFVALRTFSSFED